MEPTGSVFTRANVTISFVLCAAKLFAVCNATRVELLPFDFVTVMANNFYRTSPRTTRIGRLAHQGAGNGGPS